MEAISDNEGIEAESGDQDEEMKDLLREVLRRLDSVEKRLTNLEKKTIREKNPTENEIEREEAKIESFSDFENTVCDRIIISTSEIPVEDRHDSDRESDASGDRPKAKEGSINNKAMLWHMRMGHASVNYLKKLQKKFYSLMEIEDETILEDLILDCDVCIISRINKLPLKSSEPRATEPLQIIHFDHLGMISPATYPKKYKYVSIFTDDYSQLAMAYPMKTKDEAGYYFELFVKSARKLLGRNAKVCYLKSYQETELTSDYMVEVLERLNVEPHIEYFDTPTRNQIFNQTIQKKVRVLMYDSGLPENMWDLALGSAVFAYNRTPHTSNDMKTPLEVFNPNYSVTDITRLKRFGCLAYVKVNRKVYQKYRFVIKRLILVGYRESGYVLFNPEDGKFYSTREVRCNEKSVFAEKYKRTNVSNWENVSKEIDTDTWFIQFEKEEEEQQKKNERTISYNKRGREW